MSPPTTVAPASASLHPVRDGVSYQASRLLPALLKQTDQLKQINVLDIGPAVPETISFFGQFKSRIHVASLFSEGLVQKQQEDISEKEMKQEFQKLLNFKVGTLIDICLFWDFLNYLNRPALRAFSSALRPYIHKGTRGHGFSVLNIETPLRNQQYGIGNPETLCIRPGRDSQLDYYPHSHEELNKSFNSFEIGRGWLLPDGRLEILLNAVV